MLKVSRIARYFQFAELGTTFSREILAGCTTYFTMAYIAFVNPAILADAGMPVAAVAVATCLAAGLASILMGVIARYPIALAPGMGLNAYFAYAVVKGMGVSWQTALGAVFLSGVAFLILTLTGVRRLIVEAIPASLYSATAVGIGLFIAFIGLKNAGLVVAHPATLLTMGNLHATPVILSLFGLLLAAALVARGISAGILIAVALVTVLAWALGLQAPAANTQSITAISQTAFQLDIPGAFRLGLAEIIFAFLFVDLFDNLGTLMAVSKKAGLVGKDGRVERMDRILLTDSLATILGSLLGTSTVVSYIESASGVVAGGRTGLTSVVTGTLFLLTAFVAPLAGAVPSAATAPALILVGAFMMAHAAEIDWADLGIAFPAFLTIVAIPLTFSIANGLALGLVAYVLLALVGGRAGQLKPLAYILTLLLLVRFAYLGGA